MSTNNLSIVQSPVKSADGVPVITNWNPMIGFMIYKDQDVSSFFFYKIGLEVYTGSSAVSANLIATYKQRRNGYSVDVAAGKARAFFDIKDVVNTQLVDTVYDQNLDGIPFSTIHKLGANTYESGGSVAYRIFSVNGDTSRAKTQISAIHVRAIDCYALSTASAVTCNTPSTPVSNTSFYMQGALNLFQERSTTASGVDTDYIQGIAMQLYCLNGTSKLFLSDVGSSSYVNPLGSGSYLNYVYYNTTTQVGDFHTIAFINGETDFNSTPVKMEIKYYDSSDSLLSTSYITNAAAIGGAKPITVGTEVDEDKERILYFGCGPGNLNGFTDSSNGNSTTHKPSHANNAGWSYYTVKAVDSTNTAMSALYAFKQQEKSCKGYTMRRLAWRNSKGCWDYLNFELKSTDKIDVSRNKYSKVIGIFNKSKYRYSNWDKGQAVRETGAIRKETLNTGYLDPEQASLIKECLFSTDVYVVQNVDTQFTQSVVVTDSSYIKKTVANDKLIQYSINIEYSNEVNTNS